jgi:hypothetical protein
MASTLLSWITLEEQPAASSFSMQAAREGSEISGQLPAAMYMSQKKKLREKWEMCYCIEMH